MKNTKESLVEMRQQISEKNGDEKGNRTSIIESAQLLQTNENTGIRMSCEKAEYIEPVNNDVENNTPPVRVYGLGYRHLQMFLLFFAAAFAYVMRSNISVAIVAMTNNKTNTTNVEVFDWDKKTQDVILSSFFWGYVILQVPAGQMAERFGPKILLVVALTVNGTVSILFPTVVYWGGWMAACVCRAIQGLSQSCLQPCSSVILSKWAHVNERSRLGTLAFVGSQFGTVMSMPVVGFLCEHFGWPASFRVVGAATVGMGSVLIWLGCDKPSLHPKITIAERRYIESSLGKDTGKKVLKTPWKSIFTSIPYWALVVAHIGINWGYLTMLLELPSYLSLVLGINTQKSAMYSALPYISMLTSSLALSYLSDYLISRKTFSTNVVRKGCTAIASLGLSVGAILLTFIPVENIGAQLFVLVLSMACMGGAGCGFMLGFVDMASNFAGTLMGISNCVANVVGILAPISVGLILKNPSDITQWRIVFFVIFVIMNGSALIYGIFGTSISQSWNNPPSDTTEEEAVCMKTDIPENDNEKK